MLFFHPIGEKLKKPIQKTLLEIHQEGELASLATFPHLRHLFDAWLENKGDVDLWLYWVRRVYPERARKKLELYLQLAEKEHINVDSLKQFNLDFRHFSEPALWFELPRNSIIIIDECQQTFPTSSPLGLKCRAIAQSLKRIDIKAGTFI